jgi:hypothetical protein
MGGLVLFGLFCAGVAYHLLRIGSFYIEFDGSRYWIWQRGFLGYDHCRGCYYKEDEARAKIVRLKANPPRIIT